MSKLTFAVGPSKVRGILCLQVVGCSKKEKRQFSHILESIPCAFVCQYKTLYWSVGANLPWLYLSLLQYNSDSNCNERLSYPGGFDLVPSVTHPAWVVRQRLALFILQAGLHLAPPLTNHYGCCRQQNHKVTWVCLTQWKRRQYERAVYDLKMDWWLALKQP